MASQDRHQTLSRDKLVLRKLACTECSEDDELVRTCSKVYLDYDCNECRNQNVHCENSDYKSLFEHFFEAAKTLFPAGTPDKVNLYLEKFRAICVYQALVFFAAIQFAAMHRVAHAGPGVDTQRDHQIARECFKQIMEILAPWLGTIDETSCGDLMLFLIPHGACRMARATKDYHQEPDLTTYLSMSHEALAICWSKYRQFGTLLLDSPDWRPLITTHLESGHGLTQEQMHNYLPVSQLRALVDREILPVDFAPGTNIDAIKTDFKLAIDHIYRMKVSVIRAKKDTRAGTENHIDRWIPYWMSMNSYSEAFWQKVNSQRPHDLFKIIQCHWGAVCSDSDAWFLRGIGEALFAEYVQRTKAVDHLRSEDWLRSARVVAAQLDYEADWEGEVLRR